MKKGNNPTSSLLHDIQQTADFTPPAIVLGTEKQLQHLLQLINGKIKKDPF